MEVLFPYLWHRLAGVHVRVAVLWGSLGVNGEGLKLHFMWSLWRPSGWRHSCSDQPMVVASMDVLMETLVSLLERRDSSGH